MAENDDLIACDADGRPYTLEELRAEIQKGLDSGPAEPMDWDEIKREGRARLARERRAA